MRYFAIIMLLITIQNKMFGQNIQKDYYPSGKLMHEGKMINDTPVGTHKYYYENGMLKSEAYFSNIGLFLGVNQVELPSVD